MTKLKIIISVCFVSILFFLTYTFFNSTQNIATFKKYVSPKYKISKSLIESFNKNNDVDHTSKKQIISSILEIIEYDNWHEFIDYIDIDIYCDNIILNLNKPIIFSLNLSKDLGVIVIFEEAQDSYIFHTKIENLAFIENLQLIHHKDKTFLAVDQIIDESFGAFFKERFLQIYEYKESDFNLVWKKTLFYEEIFNENWIHPKSSNTDWTMAIEDTKLDFKFEDVIQINTFTSLKKYKASSKEMPQRNEFLLKDEKSYHNLYYWSDPYNTFVLREISQDVFISNVALIDDMEEKQEWLFGINNHFLKILTSDKEFLYLPKSRFEKLFKSHLKN